MKGIIYFILGFCITQQNIKAQALVNWDEITSIRESAVNANDYFGREVAEWNDYLVVAARQHGYDANGQNYNFGDGAVFIYHKDQGGANNWGLVKKVVASDKNIEPGARFGWGVAIDSGILAVGAIYADLDANGQNSSSSAGAVYLFEQNQGGNNNWGFVKKIVAPDRNSGDRFGNEVDLEGGILAVTAPNHDYDNTNSYIGNAGAAYIFHIHQGGNNNWGYIQKLWANQRSNSLTFGSDIAIDGDYVAVGVDEDNYLDPNTGNTVATDAGSVQLFKRDHGGANNYGFLKRVQNPWPAKNASMGNNLSFEGGWLFACASLHPYNSNGADSLVSAGAVMVFHRDSGGIDQFGFQQALVANDRETYDYFGRDVSLTDGVAVISATGEDRDNNVFGYNSASSQGSAYAFELNNGTWSFQEKVINDLYIGSNKYFGYSLIYNGTDLLVSATSSNSSKGEVFVFERNLPAITTYNNGAWDNGVPDAVTKAIINEDLAINADLYCAELELNNNPTITIVNNRFLDISGDIIGAGTIDGDGWIFINNTTEDISTTGHLSVQNLYLNHGHNLELGASMEIHGSLSCNNGHIVLGDHNFIVGKGASFSNANEDSYIRVNGAGVVRVTHERGTSRTYPVGFNPYLPIEIEIPAAGNLDDRTYDITLVEGAYADPQNLQNQQNSDAVGYMWWVNPTNLANDVIVTVQWPLTAELQGFGRSLSSLSYWYEGGGQWNKQTLSAASGNGPYNKTVNNVSFNPNSDIWFGAGSNGSPLPVSLNYFRAEWVISTPLNDPTLSTPLNDPTLATMLNDPTLNDPASTSSEGGQSRTALLSWQTATEQNNSHFMIERAMSGIERNGPEMYWEAIGRVDGHGTSNTTHNYQFVDHNVPTPLGNDGVTVYYRLKQVDYNGAIEYSAVRTLRLAEGDGSAALNIDVYPNPARDQVRFSHRVYFKIFNLQGHLVVSGNDSRVDVSTLAPGQYLVEVREGDTFARKRLMVE